jgi:hypothetical protein
MCFWNENEEQRRQEGEEGKGNHIGGKKREREMERSFGKPIFHGSKKLSKSLPNPGPIKWLYFPVEFDCTSIVKLNGV